LLAALASLPADTALDGEIVAVSDYPDESLHLTLGSWRRRLGPKLAAGTSYPRVQAARDNRVTGWSSIPLEATPVCPWILSTKPTPVKTAVPSKSFQRPDGSPQAATSAARAWAIALRAGPAAF